MQIKATEMEGMRLEMPNWTQNFNNQVAELEAQIEQENIRLSEHWQST